MLTSRLEETKTREKSAHLDELTAAAERSRTEAEKLIRTEYVKHAKALASVLAKLKTSDELIESTNRILDEHKRPTIASANSMRCRATEYLTWSKKITVNPNHPLHPHFGNAHQAGTGVRWYVNGTNEPTGAIEVDEKHFDLIVGDYAEPLWKAITLPSIEPQAAPYVHANGNQVMTAQPPTPIWKGEEQ